MPWLTISTGAIALLIHLMPGAIVETLQYSRNGLANGTLWQILTGHLTHWNLNHLIADLAVFGLLGSMVESKSRKCLALLLAGSAILISASVYIMLPGIEYYRGLSGIDMALAGFVILDNLIQSRRKSGRIESILWTIALLGLFAKPAVEMALGHPIFVQDLGANVVGLPAPHFVGAFVGIAVLLIAQISFDPRLKRNTNT